MLGLTLCALALACLGAPGAMDVNDGSAARVDEPFRLRGRSRGKGGESVVWSTNPGTRSRKRWKHQRRAGR